VPFPYQFEFFFESDPLQKVTMKARIAFATDPYAVTPTWTDVSVGFLSFATRRGRQHQLDRMEAGWAEVTLDNISGDYWPDNAGGSYYPNILPGKKINIQASFDSGTSYDDIFTGFIRKWLPGWRGKSGKGPIMTILCTTGKGNLAKVPLNDGAGYAQEVSGTRAGNVLDDMVWPAADRDFDTGQSTMIASGALANVNAFDHVATVEESELGIVYDAPDGDVQFEDRHHRLKSPHTSAVAIFGDDSGEDRYFDVELSDDDDFIFNDVRITRSGGTEQTSSDATSKGDYGLRGLSRSGLLMTSDNEALSMADYLKKRYKDPAMRAKSLTIMPGRDPGNLYFRALRQLDISSRITLRLNDASLNKDYYIEGVSHTFAANTLLWVTKYQLSDAEEQQYWALGVAGLSELGETTYLAY